MADQSRGEKADSIPGWSWILAAIGLALVVSSAGFMFYRALTGDSSPPEVAIETEAIGPSRGGYLVQIRITNHGGTVAAGLMVEGILREGTATVETSAITISYVPSGSQRKAGLFFSRDPRKFDLQIRAKGYEQP